MSVNVKRWKRPGKYMVTIRFRWPDGSVFRDRPVIDARTETQARKWGETRESERRAAGKPVPPAPVTEVATVAEFAPDWITKHAKANMHKASGIDTDERILRIHLVPFVGHLALNAVTDEVIAALKAKWIAGGILAGQAEVRPLRRRDLRGTAAAQQHVAQEQHHCPGDGQGHDRRQYPFRHGFLRSDCRHPQIQQLRVHEFISAAIAAPRRSGR